MKKVIAFIAVALLVAACATSEYAYEPSQTCVIEGCEITAIHQHCYPQMLVGQY
jgi:hypothetical protein